MTTTALALVLAVSQQSDVALARMWAQCGGPVAATAVMSCSLLIDSGNLTKEDQSRAHQLRGRARMRIPDIEAALADLTKAIELNPADWEARYFRGTAYVGLRQLDKAIADFKETTVLNPGGFPGYAALATVLSQSGQHTAALEVAGRVVELAPQFGYAVRGAVKRAARDLTGALADYDRALEIEPNSASHLVQRAIVKLELKDYDAAFRDADAAIKLAPGNPLAVGLKGLIKMGQKDHAGALEEYERALQLDPRNMALLEGRANARAALGDLAGALKDCEEMPTQGLRSPSFHRACAAHRNRAGDTRGALADYTKAIELDPKHPVSYHFRGIMKSDAHDFAGAMADWRTALTLDTRLDSNIDFVYLRLWLVEARIGDRAKATAELKATIEKRKAEKADDWVMTLADFLVGARTEEEMLQVARSDEAKSQDRLCEAYFYAGWVRLVDRDEPGARDRFEKSVATKSRTMVELISASAELKFLGGK